MSAPLPHSQPMEEVLRRATPTPWAYRPVKFDDWGYIRGPKEPGDFHGPIVAIARGDSNQSHDEHRAAGTDPYEPNARLIVEAVNSHATLKARVEELTLALQVIEGAPFSMVNDSESLRHTIKGLQAIARAALEAKP